MSRKESGFTDASAKKIFLGTLPLMALYAIAPVLVLCGWLLRDNGWQTALQIGRWLWLTILVASSLIGLPLLILTLLKNRNLRFLVWCKNLVSWVSSLAGMVLFIQHNIVAAIYVLFVGSIVTSILNTLVEKTPIKKRTSILTIIFRSAIIIAFIFRMVALIILLSIVELLITVRMFWVVLQDNITKSEPKLVSETS